MKMWFRLLTCLIILAGAAASMPVAVQAKDPPHFNTEEINRDPLAEPTVKADLIVLGTITDQMYEVITVGGSPQKTNLTSDNISTDNINLGKSAYTIFTLSVEKVII